MAEEEAGSDMIDQQDADIEKMPEKQIPRQKVIKAFEESLSLFDSYIHDPANSVTQGEQQALRFIAQAKGRTDFKNGKDTYQNKFYGEDNKVYVEGEGIPVEVLIVFLRREAANTKDPIAKRRLRKNAEILEEASKPFYQIHESMGPEALAARENQEADHFGGDLEKGKEMLTNRRELILPAKEPKPPEIPSAEFTFGVVAGKQRIEHGKSVEEMEVLEERTREIARLQMTEDRTKWQGRFSFVRQFIPRLWKSTIGEVATYNKEKGHAIKLMAESGIQMTTLPHEFLKQVDEEARQSLARKRSGIRRVWGAIRDVFHEVTFTEKDLHQERIAIIRDLRQAFEQINDPEKQKFLENHTLGKQFVDILNGDYQGSEALARRVNTEFGDQLIHSVVGEKMGSESVKLEGPVADFFKSDVIAPLLREGLANGTLSEETITQARIKIQEFFFSKRFIDWYQAAQNQTVRDSLNLSLSYGSDLIPLIQEVILPQLLQAKEHLQGAGALDRYIRKMILKVQTGTLEAGQKGVIQEGLLERAASRTVTNERVMQLYEDLKARNNAPKLVPDTYLGAAVNRASLVGNLSRLASHHVLMGVAAGVGLYAARAGTGTLGRLVIPVVGGGIVAGAFRAIQEHRLFTREREQHEVESELGYKFPPDAPRREHMRTLELHKREMETELSVPMQQIIKEIDAGTMSHERVMQLVGLIADTNARFRIMDIRGVGLLAATNPQKYQVEKTNLELTQAKARLAIRIYIDTHKELGLENLSVDSMINELTEVQINHLERGIGIDVKYQEALGNLTIEQAQSIQAKEQAFRNTRRNRVIMAGVTTAGGAIGGYFLSNFAVNRAAEFALSRNIPVVSGLIRHFGGEQSVRSDRLGNINLNEAFDNPKDYSFEDQITHERFTFTVNADASSSDKIVNVFDSQGRSLGLPMWLTKDGDHTKLIAVGSSDNLPAGLKNFVSEWQQNPTDEHNLKVYLERLNSGGVQNTPDQVLNQGSISMNTHDVTQSSSLNPDNLSYDQWAAKMGRINPATGAIEEGKMSITLKPDALHPEGIRLHGFDRIDGSFDVGKDYYVGPNYPSNSSLSAEQWGTALTKLRSEGWTVEQTPTGVHISAPSATEYIPMEKQFVGTDFGVPFLGPRVPLEEPEKDKQSTAPKSKPDGKKPEPEKNTDFPLKPNLPWFLKPWYKKNTDILGPKTPEDQAQAVQPATPETTPQPQPETQTQSIPYLAELLAIDIPDEITTVEELEKLYEVLDKIPSKDINPIFADRLNELVPKNINSLPLNNQINIARQSIFLCENTLAAYQNQTDDYAKLQIFIATAVKKRFQYILKQLQTSASQTRPPSPATSETQTTTPHATAPQPQPPPSAETLEQTTSAVDPEKARKEALKKLMAQGMSEAEALEKLKKQA